ncbi:MAG: pyridoxine 5'-phosphate synthase [Elusimicrobia bacterium]|nr:pyridoxine 5'-phosphate synthase [Elusimicrobiota bacterium]
MKLGIDISHIATLRESRGIGSPDPVMIAQVSVASGADMVMAHLRSDRKDIQEDDLKRLVTEVQAPVQFRMACTKEMETIALGLKPYCVCIVPEVPNELEIPGGFKFDSQNVKAVAKMVEKLHAAGIGATVMAEPSANSIRLAHKAGLDTVELCTRSYSEACGEKKQADEMENLHVAALLAHELKMTVHAGHSLNYHNVLEVAQIEGIESITVGFSVISRALFVGIRRAVSEMKRIIS